jgi:hypothetical protein
VAATGTSSAFLTLQSTQHRCRASPSRTAEGTSTSRQNWEYWGPRRLSLRVMGYFVGEVLAASTGGIAISFAGGTPFACRIAQCHSSSGLR